MAFLWFHEFFLWFRLSWTRHRMLFLESNIPPTWELWKATDGWVPERKWSRRQRLRTVCPTVTAVWWTEAPTARPAPPSRRLEALLRQQQLALILTDTRSGRRRSPTPRARPPGCRRQPLPVTRPSSKLQPEQLRQQGGIDMRKILWE